MRFRVPGTQTWLDLTAGPDREAFVEFHNLCERNPLFRFEPLYQQQADYLAATERTKLFCGGNQAGKTTIGIVDDVIQAVDLEAVPTHLRQYKHFEPPFECRIVTPDFTETMEGVVFQKLREWCPKDQLHGGSWEDAYKKSERRLYFKNGSKFQFLTAEQDVDKHAGQTLDRVHFDEEPPGAKGYELYRENRIRVLARGGQITLTMTPLLGMSWAFDELWEHRHEGWIFTTVADMDLNTTLTSDAKREALRGASKAELEARKRGLFVHFRGLVLANFSDDLKVPAVLPSHLRGQDVYVGIDPGIAQGGVVWAAFDRDNRMLVFDELYPENETVPQIARQIKAKNKFWGIQDDVAYIVDPSSRNRQHTDAENVEGALAREGIFCIHGQNDRATGVLQLRARCDAKALLVAENCVNWLRERDRWRVAEDEKTSEERKGDNDTFRTLGPDHLMDPTRYVAMHRVWWHPPVEESPLERGHQRALESDVQFARYPGFRGRTEDMPTTGALT